MSNNECRTRNVEIDVIRLHYSLFLVRYSIFLYYFLNAQKNNYSFLHLTDTAAALCRANLRLFLLNRCDWRVEQRHYGNALGKSIQRRRFRKIIVV